MGPEPTAARNDSRSQGSEAPTLMPGQDLYIWRKAVAEWVDLVSTAAAHSHDHHFKTVNATLGRQLYRALPASQRSIVDEAQARGAINFRQENQLKAVEEIVKLLATDPPMAIVSRLINTFSKVISCKRKPKEDINEFTSRFWGLAADHLMHANASTSSQTAEMLAIILLNNSLLPDDTLTAAKLELIRIAESRQVPSKPRKFVSPEEITEVSGELNVLDKDIVKQHNNLIQGTSTPHGRSDNSLQKLRDTHNKLRKTIGLLSVLSEQCHGYQQTSTHTDLVGHRLEFRLDDAIHVLKSLDQSSPYITQTSSAENIEGIIATRVQHALLATTPASSPASFDQAQIEALIEARIQKAMLGANSHEVPVPSYKRKTPTASRPIRRPSLTAPDGSKACYDCGSTDHVCGDNSCATPSWSTQQRRKIRGSTPAESNPFFHQGHGK
jgi:hypothetical protein